MMASRYGQNGREDEEGIGHGEHRLCAAATMAALGPHGGLGATVE